MIKTANYKLSILSGSASYVVDELQSKFPEVEVIKISHREILIFSSEENLESFRTLYSPLAISNMKGKNINLSKRKWRRGFVSAGINPSLAYIMCAIGNLSSKDILYDPFCGSSVIPVTALKYFDIKKAICSDISNKAILQSEINLTVAQIEVGRYMLFQSDISKVFLNKQNIDKIVSNLPFGIRTGDHQANIRMYEDLESLSDRVLRKKGTLVLLTQEKNLLRRVFDKKKWVMKDVVNIEQGGLKPSIFVIERKFNL